MSYAISERTSKRLKVSDIERSHVMNIDNKWNEDARTEIDGKEIERVSSSEFRGLRIETKEKLTRELRRILFSNGIQQSLTNRQISGKVGVKKQNLRVLKSSVFAIAI